VTYTVAPVVLTGERALGGRKQEVERDEPLNDPNIPDGSSSYAEFVMYFTGWPSARFRVPRSKVPV
jgi:hypothetical protein